MKADALAQLRSQKLVSKPDMPTPAAVMVADTPSKKKLPVLKRTTATMSLYPADLSRIKEIRRLIEDSGIKRVSDSEAVRVALRQVALEKTALVAAYNAMLADDQRRK